MINSFRDDYYFLSNFYPCDVTYGGVTYHNAEAAFQAQKCMEMEERRKFAELDATRAKKLGRRVPLRPDWEAKKVGFMREIVEAKFSQNPDLMEKLLATGDEILEEGNNWGDRTWGTVGGKGANLLGKILMELRGRYRALQGDLNES